MEFSDAEVADAFVYVMSRYLVNRQEQIDLGEADIGYNVVKYNPVGSADFVNPNLDVAYLEAWAAVDVDTPAILTIPRIDDRYYTAQLIDEWGEVIVNINERTFPDHPYGTFALIAPGSTPAIPGDAVVIELHSNKAKLLARVELRDDWDGAVELQQQLAHWLSRHSSSPELCWSLRLTCLPSLPDKPTRLARSAATSSLVRPHAPRLTSSSDTRSCRTSCDMPSPTLGSSRTTGSPR